MDFNINKLLNNIGISPIRSMNREFSQDFVPVEAIKDGTIIVDAQGERKFVKIMEIIPPIFEFRTPEEQQRLLMQYGTLLRNAPNCFQIKISTQLSDVGRYLEAGDKAFMAETDPGCKQQIANYITHLKNDAFYGTSAEKKYYFIFQHEGDALGLISKKSDKEKIQELAGQYNRLSDSFRNMGCRVVERKNETKEVARLLYNFYNREIAYDYPMETRIQRLKKDAALLNSGLAGNETDLKNVFAPKTIDLMEPDRITVDGKYRAYFYVDGRKYPDQMEIYGWLHALANRGFGYDVDIFYKKLDSSELLTRLRQRIKFSDLKLRARDSSSIDKNEVLDNFYGVQYLIDAIQREKQAIYDMAVLVSVYADSLEELSLKKKNLLIFAKEQDISLVDCKKLQEDAFISSGFFNTPTTRLFNRAKHIVTRDALVASYPFLSFKMEDEEGVYLGQIKGNRTLMMYDLFNPLNPNYNVFILGMTGSGKTYTLLTLLARLRYHGVQCFTITPDKQDEFIRFCEAVGGLFIDVSSVSQDRINVFDIVPSSSAVNDMLSRGAKVSWKTEKVQTLRRWLKYLLKTARPAELSELESIIVSLYTDFGITEDNETVINKKPTDMPTIGDFYEMVVESDLVSQDTKSVLRTFIDGAAKSFNGHTNVDLDNKFIVFGMENLKDDMMAPTMYITLEYIWGQIKKNKTAKKVIAIDEGWELIDGSDEDVAKSIKEIFKVIRGLGGGAIFATQSIHDLFSAANNSGSAIINSCYTQILLGMKSDDLRLTADILGLSEAEKQTILGFNRGDAYFFSGDIHVPIEIKATPEEHPLFTTKRDELEELVKSARND